MPAQMEYMAIAFSQNTIPPSPKVLRLCSGFSTFFCGFFGGFLSGFIMSNIHPQPTTESNKNLRSLISLAQQELAQGTCSAW